MKKKRHMTMEQRLQLKDLLDNGIAKDKIALMLGVCTSTVYNEIRRGTLNGEYVPTYSEERYREYLRDKGRDPILVLNAELAEYISVLILRDGKSPEQIIKHLQNDDRYKAVLKSQNTIYTAIDRGLIPGVSRENLRSNTTKVFNDGDIHIAKWARELLEIKDGDIMSMEIEGDKVIFTKLSSE